MLRNKQIDIIKGIAILAVVMYHAGFPYMNLYPFHNTIFFIVSGYLYNEYYSNSLHSLKILVLKKIKSLWLPYVIFNASCILLNNFFCYIGLFISDSTQYNEVSVLASTGMMHSIMSFPQMVKQIILVMLFMGASELGGATWFLRVLFFTVIAYAFIEYVLKKLFKSKLVIIIIEVILSITLSMIGILIYDYAGNYEGIMNLIIAQMHICFMAYGLLMIGRLCCIIKGFLWTKYHKISDFENTIFVGTLLFSLVVFIIFYNSSLKILNIEYGLFLSTISFMLLYNLSFFIGKLKKITDILSFLGRNTISIVLGHFLAFKMGNLIVVCIEGLPIYYWGAFLNIYSSKYWFIYSVVGIIIPILVYNIGKMIVKKMLAFSN